MNQPPKFLKFALLILVFAGAAVWAWRGFGPATGGAAGPATADAASVAPEPAHFVLVTYFTSNQRCPTCLKIERQTRAAIESAFADELASDGMRFQTVNFDLPENQHFTQDYELAFKTVVVSERRDGKELRFGKFDKVWDLVDKPDEFAAYLQDGVRQFLTPATDA